MLITAGQYNQTSTYDLLKAASEGLVGFDHRLLHALVDDPPRSVPDLVKWGSEEHSDALYDLSDELLSIFRHLRTPEAIPFFVNYLRRDPLEVSDEIVDALFPLRFEALEPLIQLYQEMEEDQSSEVAFILAAFRIHDPRILSILVERLEYDAHDGAIALGLYGDSAARPALEKLLGEIPEDDTHLRGAVTDALAELGRPAEEVESVSWDIWEQFPEKALPEFDHLPESYKLQFLSAPDPELRAGAAAGFINHEPSENAVKALLDRARSDESEDVRCRSWEALSDAVEDDTVRNAMMECVQDEAAPLRARAGALVGLAGDLDKEFLALFARRFYDDEATRSLAMKAMWRSMDRDFAPYFPKHLDDPDIDVKKQAIAGVGYLGIYDAAERLRPFFHDEELRPNALFAYALSARHEISRGRIRALLRKVEDAAEGLDPEEEELVQMALDERLLLHGHKPVFQPERFEDLEDDDGDLAEMAPVAPPPVKAGRNDPCPCGSGKKFKKCCGQ